MAVFGIETPIFTCNNDNCTSLLFEEVEVKSYITNGKKVAENTTSKALKCTKCGTYHNLTDEYDILEQD